MQSSEPRRPEVGARAALALSLVLAAERRAPVPPPAPGARWEIHGDALVRAGLDPSTLPPAVASRLVAGPVAAVPPLPDVRWRGVGRRSARSSPPYRVAADALLLGRLATSHERVRAFYSGRGDGPVTLVVHQRASRRRPSRIAGGAATLARLQGQTAYVVPPLVARGDGGGVDWALEGLLAGEAPRSPEFPSVARELALAMAATWNHTGTEDRPVRDYLAPGAADEVAALFSMVPRHIVGDPERLAGRLRTLVNAAGSVRVGPCHGDPVLGNVLRLPDGRLALIDWELAGVLPLAHDLVKVALGVPDVDEGYELLLQAGSLAVPGRDGAWPAEAAIAVTRWLVGWRAQAAVAERSGREGRHRGRLRRRVRLLRRALEEST